jgi:sec-independent protein translocase protein TatA
MLPHDAFPFLIGMPGGTEWIIILVIVVILFGARKIPDLARSLGKGITEFKRGLKDQPADDNSDMKLEGEDPKRLEESDASRKE